MNGRSISLSGASTGSSISHPRHSQTERSSGILNSRCATAKWMKYPGIVMPRAGNGSKGGGARGTRVAMVKADAALVGVVDVEDHRIPALSISRATLHFFVFSCSTRKSLRDVRLATLGYWCS